MIYNVITFYGKDNNVYKCDTVDFDDSREARNFIRESNSEYDKNKQDWSISFLVGEITDFNLDRKLLEAGADLT
jgi:hypothetical protein